MIVLRWLAAASDTARLRVAVRIRWIVVALAALGAAAPTTTSAQAPLPYLQSAYPQRSHVVAVFSLGDDPDLAPDQIAVAVSAAAEPNGSFVPANVRLQETASVTQATKGERARTRGTLRPGVYYVKVSAVVVGFACTPLKPCRRNWSNARRVVVPS